MKSSRTTILRPDPVTGALVAVKTAPATAKPRAPMTLATASRLYSEAMDWPRCGEGWPSTSREREAARLLADAGIDP